jgi:hypothetical protein
MSNVFLDNSLYKRDLQPLLHYYEQASIFLSINNNISIEEAKSFIKDLVTNDPEHKFVDAPYNYLEKQDNGDRQLKQTTLSGFLNDVNKNNWVLSPSMTAYSDPSKQLSPYTPYINANITKRSKFKRKMFECETNKDVIGENFNNNLQTSMKLDNNALSGAQSVASTALVNKTAHSTLTSICRITTAYGSGHCERMISGMRLYFNIDIALANITSIIEGTDFDKFKLMMDTYNLNYPTPQNVLDVIKRSTRRYTSNRKQWLILESFVRKLTPIQCAAFCYTGDFYYLRQYNENFVKSFIDALCVKVTEGVLPADTVKELHKIEEAIVVHARQVCTLETQGMGSDASKLSEQGLKTLYLTAKHIETVVNNYALMIKAIFINKNIPAYTAQLPDAVRECVLGGDTDSTFYTTQEWIHWYKGNYIFDQTSINVCSAIVFLNSATLKHILAVFSTNLGCDPKDRHRIKMKNEFRFDVFVPTQLGKHYYADRGCQEGNVFAKPKYEFKGANLISNSAPGRVIAQNKENMITIMSSVKEKGTVNVTQIIKNIARVESEIITSINKGGIEYLRTAKIKPAASYKNGEGTAAFKQYLFWNEVFAPKYGESEPPPYIVVKLSTLTEQPRDLVKWIKNIKDTELSIRLNDWLVKNDKNSMSSFTMPLSVLSTIGLPLEIKQVVDYRRIVYSACSSMYLVLESLGIYITNARTQVLALEYLGENISDYIYDNTKVLN